MTFKSVRNAALLLLLGTLALPAFSQGRHHMRHDHHPRRTAPQAVEWQRKRGWEQMGAWQEHERWEAHRAAHWEAEHRSWEQRGGYGGYYIPRGHFRRFFGEDHWFRIRSRPVIYMGYPRFAYRDYSFIMVDPYPESWDETWYASDDVYVDYVDGYYLYNRRHPGVAVAITVIR